MEQVFLQPEGMPFLEVRSTSGSVMSYDAHFHMSFSVGIIVEGQTRVFLDGVPYTARRGDIVLVAPGQVHSCNPVDGLPRGYHMLFFDAAWVTERAVIPVRNNHGCSFTRPVITEPDAYRQALELVGSLHCGTGSEDMVSRFLLAVLPHAGVAPLAADRANAARLQSGLLPPPEDIASCTISALAKKAKMRRESFSRLFRKKTGLPPRSYLHCLRIEAGRRLLRQGKSISETAFETGYADQSHFHRMFTRIVSATPGCYRKNRSHSYKK